MLKSGKMLLVIFCMMFLFACEKPASPPVSSIPQPEEPKYQQKGMPSFAPIEITYLLTNPLEIEEINMTKSHDHYRSYFRVSGLLDKTVEVNVNTAIINLYEQMLLYTTGDTIPPYRGAALAFSGGGYAKYSQVTLHPTYNYNYVLSVVAHASVHYYQNNTELPGYFSVCETLNFDLNTGEIFYLEDVFTNDTESFAIVNNTIMNRVNNDSMTFYEPFTLIAPFKGIRHGQKFYLTQSELHVVLDYNNPEFDSDFRYTVVPVSLYSANGEIAITERFGNRDKHIFEKDIAEKTLFQAISFNMHYENDTYKKDGVDWYITLRYPDDLPYHLVETMNEMRADKNGGELYSWKKGSYTYLEQNITANLIGRYIGIHNHLYLNQGNGRWENTSHLYTKTGEPVKISDLFRPEYDYHGIIKKALSRCLRESGYTAEKDLEISTADLTFQLADTHFYFTTKAYEWSPGNTHPFSFLVDYQEFGYDNLTLFDL